MSLPPLLTGPAHALGRFSYGFAIASTADPTDPVRINSVQALFVAGQVFQERREQGALLEILSGIEEGLGWTTKYHVAKLVDEWGRGEHSYAN